MEEKKVSGIGVHTRRIIAYVVLIFVTILCLFWFYILFVNATRSKADLNKGFTLLPGGHLGKNLFKSIYRKTTYICSDNTYYHINLFLCIKSVFRISLKRCNGLLRRAVA